MSEIRGIVELSSQVDLVSAAKVRHRTNNNEGASLEFIALPEFHNYFQDDDSADFGGVKGQDCGDGSCNSKSSTWGVHGVVSETINAILDYEETDSVILGISIVSRAGYMGKEVFQYEKEEFVFCRNNFPTDNVMVECNT